MAQREGKSEARERFVEAFVDLFEEKALRDITVKELLSRAHVSRSTFYYHFADVDSIVAHPMDEILTEHEESLIYETARDAEGAVLEDVVTRMGSPKGPSCRFSWRWDKTRRAARGPQSVPVRKGAWHLFAPFVAYGNSSG